MYLNSTTQPVRSLGERMRRELDPRFLNTHGVQASATDRAKLQALLDEHDLVWVYGVRIVNAFNLWRWPRTILDVDDVPSLFHGSELKQARGGLAKLRKLRQVILWHRRERLLSDRFETLVASSETDRQYLGGSEKIFLVPNGFEIPTRTLSRTLASPPRIGFIGTLQYPANVEGLRWFIKEVWPQIRKVMPEAVLRLVGQDTDKPEWRASENVEGLGWVSDPDQEMATWALTIVPLFVGGGTRVKIATAFSRKCPVVATNLGALGYDVSDGRELLMADAPSEFAGACLLLLQNSKLGDRLAEAAWKTFLTTWSWDAISSRVNSVVQFNLRHQTNRRVIMNSQGANQPAPDRRLRRIGTARYTLRECIRLICTQKSQVLSSFQPIIGRISLVGPFRASLIKHFRILKSS